MTALSSKDQSLIGAFVIVLLLGILALWFPKARASWQAQRKRMESAETQLAREQTIIALRPEILKQYDALCGKMPLFPEGKSVDTYWLPIMDNTARSNNVNIAQRSIGGEETLGEVTELTLECRDWEGRLDSLIWFLYDIETRQDAMMDIRSLTIRPSSKKPGFLQGTFTLNCAYMRQSSHE
ncbi:MAG: hypothetical protein RR982_06460 [Kiritimatiellia bacterium]